MRALAATFPGVRYAAFLRAINVGKHNRVTMVVLRDLLAGAGLRDVSTYLQTGNVLFDFDGDEAEAVARIDVALAGHGLRNAAASVRRAEDLAELVALQPFAGMAGEPKDRFATLFQAAMPLEVRERLRGFPGVVSVRERELMTMRLTPPTREQNAALYLSKAMTLQGTVRYWHVVESVAGMFR